jgi:transposase
MSLLQRLLEKRQALDLVRARSDMRTDSTHVLASIRNVNQSDLVGETIRAALNVLATVDPRWTSVSVPPSWYPKYARRFECGRRAQTKDEIIAAAEEIGRDGLVLLEQSGLMKRLHSWRPRRDLNPCYRRERKLA